MKHHIPNSRIICCASIFALSLAACSNNAGKLKNDVNLTENGSKESTSQLVKLKKGHRTNRLTGKFPDPRSYDNLWDRLFDHYDLPEVSHQDIDREFNWFMNHPTYIERVQSRAEPFLYSIVKQLEKQHMPGELALLPVIESAFQPHAVSPANAAGIWQFIPATGHHYGLKRSVSYDGRRDIYASTRAAIKYLKKLHNEFNGDWLLAIAGYNCGEGAVARAMQRNIARGLPTDFWSLNLPQETRTYVPRLLAVAKLFSESEQYGISLRPIPNKPLYKTVVLKDQVDLALAANAADISLDRLFELNPGFKRQRVDVNGSYRLFIPAHKKSIDFHEDLARQVAAQADYDQPNLTPTDENLHGKPANADTQTPAPLEQSPASAAPSPAPRSTPPEVGAQAPITTEKPVETETETPPPQTKFQAIEKARAQAARSDDTTGGLPKQPPQQVAMNETAAQNSTVSSYSQREARREPFVLAPAYTSDSPSESTTSVALYERIASAAKDRQSSRQVPKSTGKIANESPSKEHAKPAVHETVASIEHEREDRDLVHGKNKPVLKNHVEPAEEHKQIEASSVGKKSAYVVHEGDTLNSIAHKYDMDVDDLKKLNRVSDADDIKWGQNMKVVIKDTGKKLTGTKAAAPAYKTSVQNTKYKAHDGETLFSISRRFNVTVADLRKWNGIKADKQFHGGTNIYVSGEKD